MVAVKGVGLFESWKSGGAFKIWGGAMALGGAVLDIFHVLGTGPSTGILVGISGAAEVSLAGAAAVIHQSDVPEGALENWGLQF